jgi:hypothetical protein
VLRRVPGHGFFLLPSLAVEFLGKVPFARDERHGNKREFQVGSRLDGVSGQNAKTAAVSRDVVLNADFHGKIGDHGLGNKLVQVVHTPP